jgi:hypothetical protein
MYAAAFDNHTIYRIGRRQVSDARLPGTAVSGRPVAAGTYLARFESAYGRPAVQAKLVRLR